MVRAVAACKPGEVEHLQLDAAAGDVPGQWLTHVAKPDETHRIRCHHLSPYDVTACPEHRCRAWRHRTEIKRLRPL